MKWRGVLFLRFLLSLVDESEKIRQLADFLFGNILKGNIALTIHHSHFFLKWTMPKDERFKICWQPRRPF